MADDSGADPGSRLRKLREETANEVVDPNQPIKVLSLDMHVLETSKNHRTEKYQLTKGEEACLVVRRGQNFKLSFLLDREVNWGTDDIQVLLSGSGSTENSVRLPLDGQMRRIDEISPMPDSGWGVGITFQDRNMMSIAVIPSSMAAIGVYKVIFEIRNGATNMDRKTTIQDPIYLIFNPWNPSDGVFMPDEAERAEYVLNEYGKVYQGTYDSPMSKAWYYGQFDTIVLPTCAYLFELGKMTTDDLRDPVMVARQLSALADAKDDYGILVGKWDGEYSSGISPVQWASSTSIVEMFMRRGGSPVMFGQCWVYAAIVTTLCRALGMPCRPVTNFESAHDTDGNLTVDTYKDSNANLIASMNFDSSWNFHLWNEVWMKRPDVGEEWDGWQAIDATPQEMSDGKYQLGPCPVKAVQWGRTDINYDTKFVYAETNAVFVDYIKDSNEPSGWKVLPDDNKEAGKLILTKKVGEMTSDTSINDALDITATYKSKTVGEGRGALIRKESSVGSEDVQYHLDKIKSCVLGTPFNVKVTISNLSNEVRTVNLVISVASLQYTGSVHKNIKRVKIPGIVLQPQSSEEGGATVDVADYQDKLCNQCLIKVMVGAVVQENKKTWGGQYTVNMKLPKMEINAERNPSVPSEILYMVGFTNPLGVSLTNCELGVMVPGVLEQEMRSKVNDVQPGQNFSYQGKVVSGRSNEKNFLVSFRSDQIEGLQDSLSITI